MQFDLLTHVAKNKKTPAYLKHYHWLFFLSFLVKYNAGFLMCGEAG